MSALLSAIALASAAPAAPAPAAASAPTQAPAPKKECCCAKMERPMACCAEHGAKPAKGEAGQEDHKGHDMNH